MDEESMYPKKDIKRTLLFRVRSFSLAKYFLNFEHFERAIEEKMLVIYPKIRITVSNG